MSGTYKQPQENIMIPTHAKAAAFLALFLLSAVSCDQLKSLMPAPAPDNYVRKNIDVRRLSVKIADDKRTAVLTGYVKNTGDRDLKEAWVLVKLAVKEVGDTLLDVGPISAGESKNISMDVETLNNDAFVVYYQIMPDSGSFQ